MRIFVSYTREHREAARALTRDLEAVGHAVWMDDALQGGQTWWEQILEEIRRCDFLVLVLTTESLDSTACDREMNYAAAVGKPILPVLAADGVSIRLLPSLLAQVQHVDYRERDKAAALRAAGATWPGTAARRRFTDSALDRGTAIGFCPARSSP